MIKVNFRQGCLLDKFLFKLSEQLFFLSILLIFSITNSILANELTNTGTIRGSVTDQATLKPLLGANVLLKGTLLGTATNEKGEYRIENIPVGTYSIQFSYIGYDQVLLTDIIVRSDRITFVNAELVVSRIQSKDVLVMGGYFPEINVHPTSVYRFSNEEIRRAATIGGDINRIINGLPSLSNENQNNYIVARGGSNIENSFYIDNIRVSNLNHFPVPGTTGGGISLLNVDFIKEINVLTGGFSSRYGDALSSVIDVQYREGNSEQTDFQVDLNITGLSGAVEGPINDDGAYMLQVKHSFTDILFSIIDIDQQPVVYDEIQTKIVYKLSNKSKLSLLYLFGTDRWNIPRDDALSRSDNSYGDFKMLENIIGVNWQYIWGESGYSNTSISHSFTKNKIGLFKTLDQSERLNYQTNEQLMELRNINYFIPGLNHRLELGFNFNILQSDYNNFFDKFINQYGTSIEELYSDGELFTWESGGFINYTWNPISSLEIVTGIRLNYFEYNEFTSVSPRLAVTYHFNNRTSLSGAAGIYHQHLPLYFLTQYSDFKRLGDMQANHFIVGINHLLAEDLKLTLELYSKDYRNCPLDKDQPALFILDENIYNQFYSYHKNLVTTGEAIVRGIELMLQKKFSDKFYGLISSTYYRARYRDLNGIWRNRVTDNQYLFAAEIGFKPDEEWEFNLRWSYAGGLPYSAYDQEASQNAGTGIYDVEKIMEERLPAYSSVSLRVDKRFYFGKTNMIIYLSIWNLLNRENISYHFWDDVGNNGGNYTQFPMLPVLGIEFEF